VWFRDPCCLAWLDVDVDVMHEMEWARRGDQHFNFEIGILEIGIGDWDFWKGYIHSILFSRLEGKKDGRYLKTKGWYKARGRYLGQNIIRSKEQTTQKWLIS